MKRIWCSTEINDEGLQPDDIRTFINAHIQFHTSTNSKEYCSLQNQIRDVYEDPVLDKIEDGQTCPICENVHPIRDEQITEEFAQTINSAHATYEYNAFLTKHDVTEV